MQQKIALSAPDLLQLVKHRVVEHLDIRSLHAGGPGLDDAGAFKLVSRSVHGRCAA